jgi:hypothetical protein
MAAGEKGSGGYFPANWKGLAAHRGPVIAYGDATGGATKSMTGFTPWSIVNEVLREACQHYSTAVPRTNPLQQIRVRSMNGRFCNARQERLLFVDPSCREHLHDLLVVQTNPDGTIKKPGGPRPGSDFWKRTHLSDALGCLCCERYPMGHDVNPRANLPESHRRERIRLPSVL